MFDSVELSNRVIEGGRITPDEALHLYETASIHTLGRMANAVRERLHGDRCYYNINRHIDPTNICAFTCTFCAFARRPGEAGGYVLSADEIVAKAKGLLSDRLTELHMVGGCHPKLGLDYYEEILRALKRELPHVHLKTMTAVEIDFLAKKERITHREVLERLRAAGLDSMPGGGAEIFSERVRDEVCPGKADGEAWLAIHRTAHELGIRTNCTMLYGHIETGEEIIDHLTKLRSLQDETGGFQTFIPLAYHAANTDLGGHNTGGLTDLRVMAISRIVLDNIPHVKAYWIMLGLKLSQLALSYGADDLDGTVLEEQITHDAGADSPQQVNEDELIRIIREAGRVPVERDTCYNVVHEHAAA